MPAGYKAGGPDLRGDPMGLSFPRLMVPLRSCIRVLRPITELLSHSSCDPPDRLRNAGDHPALSGTVVVLIHLRVCTSMGNRYHLRQFQW